MSTIKITDINLYNQIKKYCKINNLKISDFCTKLLKSSFSIELYGDVPFLDFSTKTNISPPIEKEKEIVDKNEAILYKEETIENPIIEVKKETSNHSKKENYEKNRNW